MIRGVVDNGADPAPVWKVYVDLGWTELTDPSDAVALAIVLEELGRATDPTPFLATMTQFAPLAPGLGDAGRRVRRCLRVCRRAATPRGGYWMEPHAMCSTVIVASGWLW